MACLLPTIQLERFVEYDRGMRLSSLLTLALPLSLTAMGCLPKFSGTAPGDFAMSGEDMAHDDTPPVGEPDPVPAPPDLAGTVIVDMFTTTGTSTIALSESTGTLRLNESKTVTITITPNGATGTGTLALANAPAGVTAVFTPATVTLAGAPVTATMTITTAGDMTAANSVATRVQLAVGGTTSTSTFGVTVLPELVVTISKGVALTNNLTAFGAAMIPVKLVAPGTKVTFVNNDGVEHRIHADGTGGIAHAPNNMAANGGSYTQTINAAGDISFYCHIHPGMKGTISVKP